MTSTARKFNQGGSLASDKSRGALMNNRVITIIAALFALTSVIALMAVLFLIMLLPARAQAAEPRFEPSVLVTTSVGYGVVLKTGTALPPGIVHGVAVAMPLRHGWGYLGEV